MGRHKGGWIKFHRKALDSLVAENGYKLSVWTTLLLSANHSESRIRFNRKLITIKPGQLVTSYRELSDRLGFARMTIFRVMKQLKEEGSISIDVGREGTLVTICNYEKYQVSDEVVRDAGDDASDDAGDDASDTPNGETRNKKEEIINPNMVESGSKQDSNPDAKLPPTIIGNLKNSDLHELADWLKAQFEKPNPAQLRKFNDRVAKFVKKHGLDGFMDFGHFCLQARVERGKRFDLDNFPLLEARWKSLNGAQSYKKRPECEEMEKLISRQG